MWLLSPQTPMLSIRSRPALFYSFVQGWFLCHLEDSWPSHLDK